MMYCILVCISVSVSVSFQERRRRKGVCVSEREMCYVGREGERDGAS